MRARSFAGIAGVATLVFAAASAAAPPPVTATPPVTAAPPVTAPVDPAVVRIRIVPPPAATAVPGAAAAAGTTPLPLICKSSLETGSLVARRKQCLTKAQWQYVDEVQRQQNQQLFDDQRSKQGCGGPSC